MTKREEKCGLFGCTEMATRQVFYGDRHVREPLCQRCFDEVTHEPMPSYMSKR